jgi:hypothetical protein
MRPLKFLSICAETIVARKKEVEENSYTHQIKKMGRRSLPISHNTVGLLSPGHGYPAEQRRALVDPHLDTVLAVT